MSETIPVNFHCHSIFSDGDQTPESLATGLAAAGTRYAALTDHDSIEGLPRFQEALKKRGIAYLPGVELTTQFKGREAHLLAYGFDPHHPELAATLISLRQMRAPEVHSIADSLRKIGAHHVAAAETLKANSAAPDGRLEMKDAIELVHRAGGRAFWAHPLHFEPDLQKLQEHVAELKEMGLDGIEAIYAPFNETQRHKLREMATENELLVCAGTDLHTYAGAEFHGWSIDMSREEWGRFRDAVFSSPTFSEPSFQETDKDDDPTKRRYLNPHHSMRRSYVLRIFLPTLIAIALFLAAIWGILLPSFEKTLIDRKRELIRELTNSVWSILASYERDVQNGLLNREQAQGMAAVRIEALRYGPEGKDYFWIQDMQPRMVMHPYRSDLNGKDLSSYSDPLGAHIFIEFADKVRRQGSGYIDYVWQWKDDPQRLEPKESYVQGFEPWGWVIGTGIYLDDVHDEIKRIERNIINAALIISGAMVLLMLIVLHQSLRIERERQETLDNLHESTERYHTLVEATTEGTLLIIDDRCRYANPTFLAMTGYSTRQLEFLELVDILPMPDNQIVFEHLGKKAGEPATDGVAFDGVIRHADGRLLECLLTINPMNYAGRHGFILLAKDIARRSELLSETSGLRAAQAAPVGIFRARAARRAVLLEMNPTARTLFDAALSAQKGAPPALADVFADQLEFDAFMQRLQADGEVIDQVIVTPSPDAAARFFQISAKLVRDDRSVFIDGSLRNISVARRKEAARETLIAKLQASLLFLHEPLSRMGRTMLICDIRANVAQVARLMTARKVNAALIAGESGAIIGIVSDHDLRARILAEKLALDTPIHAVMSAPVEKISEDALIYEALMRMEEHGLSHLAVQGRDGRIVSVIDSKSLIQFQRYGPVVLAREIAHAKDADQVARSTERTPPLAKSLLDSSAKPQHVTDMLSSICDAAAERLVQLAVAELGPPPANFCVIAMGSQGRRELTLVTDQDNGIIYDGDSSPDSGKYFLRLGKLFCDGLNHAGYSYCPGGVMANNPRWCRSLSEWIDDFKRRIRKSEPQEIMDFSIAFDFRSVYGDAELTRELRSAIHLALVDEPAFFTYFAQHALTFKPPARVLNIYLGGEHAGEINLKDAMMPIITFARLYALRHQINRTHTLERIDALVERSVIPPSSRDEIVSAYDVLMLLRLRSQISGHEEGHASNTVHLTKLPYIQQGLLKQAFAQIAAVQKKVSYDFLGGV